MKRLTIFALLCSAFVSAQTYWVSPTGTSSWASCQSATLLSGTSACSVATANANAAGGNTVYFVTGTYSSQNIAPANSGTSISNRITFAAYPGQTPTFSGLNPDVELSGNSYIVISGFTFNNTTTIIMRVEAGANHIEVANNTFNNTDGGNGLAASLLYMTGVTSPTEVSPQWVTHNWIHNNTFSITGQANGTGGLGCTDGGGDDVWIGSDYYYNSGANPESDNYNTFENNVISHAPHAGLSTYGTYLVVRNNVIHNEPWSSGCADNDGSSYNAYTYSTSNPNYTAYNGLFGHRNLQYSTDDNRTGTFVLTEGNRFGYAGVNQANDGADGLTIASPQNITRYNFIYASMNPGILFKYQFSSGYSNGGHGGTFNRVYNNTIYQAGYGYPWALTYGTGNCDLSYCPWPETAISLYQGCGTLTPGGCDSGQGNWLKNNIFYESAGYTLHGWDVADKGAPSNGWYELNAINNWCTGAQTGGSTDSNGNTVCSASGNPNFVNPSLATVSSTTLPNLSLQSGSSAANGGTNLTTATASGTNSTSLPVADALYFQDGTWGSALAKVSAGLGGTMQPDKICVGTVSNCATISAVTYGTYNAPAGTITLASALTWSNGAAVWLYSKSDGTVVMNTTGPDYGAGIPAATPSYTLTVVVVGSGSVSSSPGGILCPATSCSASYTSGTNVTLTATASTNFTFTGWAGGGCSGLTCVTDVTSAETVTAYFVQNRAAPPKTWQDVNAPLDGVNCGGSPGQQNYCAGAGFVAPTYEILLPNTWIHGPQAGCTFHNPYWPGSPTSAQVFAGCQQILNDVDACRNTSGYGTIVDMPAGTLCTTGTSPGLVIPAVETSLPTQFNIMRSAAYASFPIVLPGLPALPCSLGTQLNVYLAVDPSIDNDDCTGTNMSFTLGPANTSSTPGVAGTITGVTQISVNTTTLAAITASGSPQLVPLANGYVSPTLAGAGTCFQIEPTTSATQECVTPVSGANQSGLYAVFSQNHASGVCVVYNVPTSAGAPTNCGNGTGAFTLANGTPTNITAYNGVALMWTIEFSGTGTSGPPLTTCSPVGTNGSSNPPWCNGGANTTFGPAAWEFQGAEIRISAGNTTNMDIVQSGAHVNTETSINQLPSYMIFNQVWLHGDWTNFTTGRNQVSGALVTAGNHIVFENSDISEIIRPGAEGYGIWTDWGQNLKFVHYKVRGASNAILSGGFIGAGPTSVVGLVPNSNVENRRCMLDFPYWWLGLSIFPASNTQWHGQSLTKKNTSEYKTGVNDLDWGCIFRGDDNSGGQSGIVLSRNIRNSAGGVWGSNYPTTLNNQIFGYNLIADACEGITLDSSDGNDSGGGVSSAANLFLFTNNLSFNISGSNPGCAGVSPVSYLQIDSNAQSWQGTNTCANGVCTFVANCSVAPGGGTGGNCLGQVASLSVATVGTGCVAGSLTFSAPNIATGVEPAGTYTCSGGGLATATIIDSSGLAHPGAGYTSTPTATLATGTGTVTVTMVSSSISPSGTTGYQAMDVNAGDAISMEGCQTFPSMDTPTTTYAGFTYPSGVGPIVSVGSAPWTNTWSAGNVTVSYPSTVTGTDSSGYCTLFTGVGRQPNFQFVHNGVISTVKDLVTNAIGLSGIGAGPNFQINTLMQNNYWIGSTAANSGWCGNFGGACGSASENIQLDTTSATVDHDYWPGLSGLAAWGVNPVYPVASPQLFYPANSCGMGFNGTGAWAYGTCSGNAVVINAADYHQYECNASGTCYHAASDGTDIGPSIPAIDAAQTLNVFNCALVGQVCAGPGPYPDSLIAPTVGPAAIFAEAPSPYVMRGNLQ